MKYILKPIQLRVTETSPEVGWADREEEAVSIEDGSSTRQGHIGQLFPAQQKTGEPLPTFWNLYLVEFTKSKALTAPYHVLIFIANDFVNFICNFSFSTGTN